MATLPDGALTVASLDPERSWSPERHMAANIEDSIMRAALIACGVPVPDAMRDAPRVVRPADEAAAQRASRSRAERVSSVRGRIEGTNWEEVTDG